MKPAYAKTQSIAFGAGAGGAFLTAMGPAIGWTSVAAIWPVGVICAAAGALVHHTGQSLAQMVDNRTRTLRDRLERLHRDVGDIHGLVRLQSFTQHLPLPMGGGWALTGDSAALLVRETLLRQPRTIVELGSGVSTLLLGQVLKQRGSGRLLSIDHDPEWAERTRRQARFLGLEEYVTVVDAPLHPLSLDDCNYDWYDIPPAALDALGRKVDLLVVDGPPQGANPALITRYPALPVFADRLSSDAWIFVDDAKRLTETAMVERWMQRFPGWLAQHYDTVDGVCLLARQ